MDDLVLKDDVIEYHWTFTGTSSETGKWVQIPGFEEWRIGADGLIAESRGQYDQAEYDRQLRREPARQAEQLRGHSRTLAQTGGLCQRLMSRDLFLRGRPGKRFVDPRRVPGQVPLAAAVGVHDVDVVVAVALASEGDLLPVWRPERLPPALGQPSLSAAVGVDDVDLVVAAGAVAAEGDPPPVGRPGRSRIRALRCASASAARSRRRSGRRPPSCRRACS